jgi:membrane protease YdiL (CAAX protease family)
VDRQAPLPEPADRAPSAPETRPAPHPAEPVEEGTAFPAWPAAAVAILGALVLFAGIGMSGGAAMGQLPESAVETGQVLTIAGFGLLLLGLVAAAVRSLAARRRLPEHRYRGPAILLLFALVLAFGNLLSLPFAEQLAGALLGGEALPAGIAILVLVITPAAILAVTALFVLLPRALAGLRLTDGAATPRNLLRGLGLGLPMWLGAAIASAIVAVIYQLVTGEQPTEQQAVVNLVGALPLPLALVAAAVLAPLAEELFFRGVAFNAWERERGPRWALFGSALLFAAVHLLDGAFLVFVPILIVGLVLALAYRRTRSLPLVFGMHASFNAVSLLLAFFLPGLQQ